MAYSEVSLEPLTHIMRDPRGNCSRLHNIVSDKELREAKLKPTDSRKTLCHFPKGPFLAVTSCGTASCATTASSVMNRVG